MKAEVTMHFLGTASGIPTKNRYTESIAMVIDNDIYLLDGGEPCSASLVRKGINYNNIIAIFISHMHIDHFGGIPMLIQLMELTGRKSPLKLFVPEEAIDGLIKYLKIVYLFDEMLHFKVEILPIKESEPTYQDKHLTLSAYPNNHLKKLFKKKYPYLKLESYSFHLELDKKRIVYSGDIDKPEDLEPLLKEKIDLLISEIAHFKPEELFSYLSSKKIDRILLTHIHPDLNDREKELERIGNKSLGGNRVFVAYDGFKIKI